MIDDNFITKYNDIVDLTCARADGYHDLMLVSRVMNSRYELKKKMCMANKDLIQKGC